MNVNNDDPFDALIGFKGKLFIIFASVTSIMSSLIAGKYQNDLQDLTVPPSNTVFVWEFVRHGARAPMAVNDYSDFPVPVENLTPQGMRQRYLLGRYLNERVNRPFGFNHTEYADFVEN